MQRYKICKYRVNKEKVKRYIVFKYGSMKNYCENFNISKMRLWQIITKPHLSIDVNCLQNLAKKLDLSIDEILM